MAKAPSDAPVVQVKPQPDVYTIMLIIAIIALAVSIGFVLWTLIAAPPNGYGLSLGEIFGPLKGIPGK
jgi:hypothetical protein